MLDKCFQLVLLLSVPVVIQGAGGQEHSKTASAAVTAAQVQANGAASSAMAGAAAVAGLKKPIVSTSGVAVASSTGASSTEVAAAKPFEWATHKVPAIVKPELVSLGSTAGYYFSQEYGLDVFKNWGCSQDELNRIQKAYPVHEIMFVPYQDAQDKIFHPLLAAQTRAYLSTNVHNQMLDALRAGMNRTDVIHCIRTEMAVNKANLCPAICSKFEKGLEKYVADEIDAESERRAQGLVSPSAMPGAAHVAVAAPAVIAAAVVCASATSHAVTPAAPAASATGGTVVVATHK